MEDNIKINRAELMQQVDKLLQENERLTKENWEMKRWGVHEEIKQQSEQIKKLEGLLHKILKESVGGNVPFSFELYNEIKAALNL